MRSELNDEYLMMHIMNNENMEDKLNATLDPLTMSQLRDKISEKYEKIKRRKGYKADNSGSDDEEERALFAKTFKGRCRKSGKFGHKGSECRSDDKKRPWTLSQHNGGGGSNSARFQGKCNHCGKYGHKELQCWAKHGKPGARDEQNN